MEWVERLLEGDQIAASKLISLVENKSKQVPEIMRLIHPHTGSARIVPPRPSITSSRLVRSV
jgi:putative protein kinase ArgK-like GTPase of G3E family